MADKDNFIILDMEAEVLHALQEFVFKSSFNLQQREAVDAQFIAVNLRQQFLEYLFKKYDFTLKTHKINTGNGVVNKLNERVDDIRDYYK